MTDADVITRLLHGIDALDWAAVRASFADEVRVDYTSLWGGEPATVPVDALLADWQEFMRGLAATQHLAGPVLLRDGLAETHVRAHHWLPGADGGDTWTVYGHYVAELVDGRIAALTLQTYHTDGNPDLPRIARERAATSPVRG